MSRSAVLEKVAAAQKAAQKSEEEADEALAAVKALERAEQQLQRDSELAAERSQCAKLREELAAAQTQLANVMGLSLSSMRLPCSAPAIWWSHRRDPASIGTGAFCWKPW